MNRGGGRSLAYIGGRLLAIVPLALAASVVMFLVMQVLPGDVALTILSGSTHTEAMREALRAELGLNDPWYRQYLSWLAGLLDGSGVSLETKESLVSIIARQLPVTMLLAAYATVISLVSALPLGVVAALHRNRWPDRVIRVVSLAGLSIPLVWLALLVLMALIRLFGWSPPIIYSGLLEEPWTHLQMMAFPSILLAWEYGSHLVRVTRATVSQTLGREFIAAARSRGVSEVAVIFRYGLRNSLLPPLTVLGLQFGSLIGGALVLETVFGLPGIGRGLVRAATARDIPVVLTQSVVLVVAYQVVNLGVDALYLAVDPRVRFAPREHP